MKVVSSYQSVVRGVSEQVPQQRHPGQHYEQVNMLSDPVHGLARRHGSVTLDERLIDSSNLMTPSRVAWARNYREYSFFVAGTEYSLVYQAYERSAGDALPFCFVLNKDTGKFLNVNLVDPAALAPWIDGGVSAITTVGQFVIMAAQRLGPGYSMSDPFKDHSQQAVAWVRGGAYSRTYTLKVTRASDNTQFTATYTTMASSYPNLLNTSDIPATNPDGTVNKDYQKLVNDRVYAYNSAVNKWVGDAAADIQPQNIAQKLVDSLTSQGFVNIGRLGGTVYFDNVTYASADDAGDGSLLRLVFNEVDDVSKLSGVHAPGKVVRIKAKGADPYYMVATGDQSGSTTGSWQTVTWEEAAAQVVTPGQVFALGAVSPDGKTFHVAATPAALAAATGLAVPGYSTSKCGDSATRGAVPYFFGRRITLLTVFQDRLVIVANGVVFLSRTGDYFNWFRDSAISVKDDDPIEVYALGAEDDIIHRSVTYSKDLFMFGERKQYAISGRVALTPKTAAIMAAANERDSTHAQPCVVGNLLFYGKYAASTSQIGPSQYAGAVSQFQLGLFQDTPETFKISQQLGLYLHGRPTELAAMSSPSTVFLRTDGYDNGVYVYSFIDQPGSQQRAFDSWSRWQWAPEVGQIIGMSAYKATLYVFVLRIRGAETWVACEKFTMDSTLSDRPYLDMQRRAMDYMANVGFLGKTANAPANGAVGATGDIMFMGASLSGFDAFWQDMLGGASDPNAYVGMEFDSYVVPTQPFTRDQNNNSIVNGRLVVTRYSVSVSETGGMLATLRANGTEKQVLYFNGRLVGHSNNLPSRQPVTTTVLNVPAGRSNMEHTIKLQSVRWLPLTVTAMEWVGQFFNNARRV